MSFIITGADGKTLRYRDPKRYLWLAALTGPFIPPLCIWLYLATGSALTLLIPAVYTFVWIPIADAIFGEDTNNPPDAAIPAMSNDNYYRALLHIHVVLLYANFLLVVWFVGTHHVPWWAFIALALGTALSSVDALTVGHELGHKQNWTDRVMALISLGLVGYGHFRVEHNRGHHVHVATPQDCVSARMGESVYRFAMREIPGALTRGWALEAQRMEKKGRSRWSPGNEILQSWFLTGTVAVVLIALFGPIAALFIAIHHAYAWFGLSQANYVEHYGLLRQKLPNGRYEPTQPRHSWNTNHIYSNVILFHLQRHSDHHANALRPYQALRDFDNLPRLPSGYPGCFGLAAVPSMWFKVMDERLLEWAGGDITKINVDPREKDRLYAKYGAGRNQEAPEQASLTVG